jgi:ferredoxin
MPSYALSMEKEFLPIFERAQKEEVGVILMKTGRGLNGAYEDSVPHYLATAGITTICKGAASFPEIKGLIEASKVPADEQAGIRLRETSQLAMSGHCLMCGACEERCPKGLQVADVVRCSDYYLENPELVATALETYRELSRTPSPSICGDCNLCERACRNGVPVVHHIRRAESILA